MPISSICNLADDCALNPLSIIYECMLCRYRLEFSRNDGKKIGGNLFIFELLLNFLYFFQWLAFDFQPTRRSTQYGFTAWLMHCRRDLIPISNSPRITYPRLARCMEIMLWPNRIRACTYQYFFHVFIRYPYKNMRCNADKIWTKNAPRQLFGIYELLTYKSIQQMTYR